MKLSYFLDEDTIDKIDKAMKKEIKKGVKHVKRYVDGSTNPKVNLDKFKRQNG